MTKAGKKLIEAMKEAVAVAKGEQEPARVTVGDDLSDYIKERDQVMAQDDLDTFIKWAKTKGANYATPEVANISRHKIITASVNLPEALRTKSRNWLLERGYQPYDS